MEDISPKYVDRETINSLIDKLDLPELDPFMQDWEYEVGNSTRIEEFVAYYENHSLTIKEKFALMIIIISSFDDYLSEGKAIQIEAFWRKIKKNLLTDHEIHIHTIAYWAIEEEELEDCFAVTPYIREVKNR